MDKVIKIKELVKELNEASRLYYGTGQTIMSDAEFDAKLDLLKQLEKETSMVMSNSPTIRVGYKSVSGLAEVKHSHPMLSLDKTKSVNDLIKFYTNHDALLMLKMDGLSILATYDEKGDLVRLETRGDAIYGDDITHNAVAFMNLPTHIDKKGGYEIEGEAIISKKDFVEINRVLIKNATDTGKKKGLTGANLEKYIRKNSYQNERNLASGSVRLYDSNVAKDRRLQFVAWKVPTTEGTMIDNFNEAQNLGFDIVPFVFLSHQTVFTEESMNECISILTNSAKCTGFPIDGLVQAYNDIPYGLSLGTTNKYPRHSIAFKFYEDEEYSIVRDIEWQVGRSGVLSPVVLYDPVFLNGSTISRASVHNISVLKELELGTGDRITVIKAQEIIPQIRKNLTCSNTFEIPSVCPICGGKTEVRKDNDSEVLYCTNPDCQGKLLGKLTHAVSRNALNIDGLSEATIETLIKHNLLTCIKDIYHLDQHKKFVSALPGFGAKSVTKLLNSIEASRTTTLDRFLYSLSIPLLGKSASKDISRFCEGNIDVFLDYVGNPTVFKRINGIGDALVGNIEAWYDENKDVLMALLEEFTFENDRVKTVNGSDDLTGKTFVITGKLKHFSSRDLLKAKLEDLGAKVSGSVSKNTTALINNDINSTSGKNAKAKALGVEIWSEDKLLELIGE